MMGKSSSRRSCGVQAKAGGDVVRNGGQQQQQQLEGEDEKLRSPECSWRLGHCRVRWTSSFVLAITALLLATTSMGGVGALHDNSNLFYGMKAASHFNADMVNATAKVSPAWRTGFHFQPRKNWMNDPNGPMHYKGYYHLFYQFDPFSALWGNITWGHAVSTDLIHWKYVDDAAIQGGPGWYDLLGAWSGSATFMADGTPRMMYTGWSNVSDVFQIQTQNMVIPVDASDPLLKYWKKSESNPVIVAEPGMNASEFRDPTQGWKGKDGLWRILIGSKVESNGAGTAYVYTSPDFVKWTFLHELHTVLETGMWECPDFYPVALDSKLGLDISVTNVPGKHIVKVSLDDKKHDCYTVGTYNTDTDKFEPDDLSLDVGLGLRYDYGKFYASKTFFDAKTSRRILFGWINESTSDQNAIITGWSGLQSIPRQVWLDKQTHAELVQVPIAELDGLHKDHVCKQEFTLSAGSVVPITGVSGPQLDIQVQFYKPEGNQKVTYNGTDASSMTVQEICSANGGAALRGVHGPFGLLVLADQKLLEQTAVYFYVYYSTDNAVGSGWKVIFCSDQRRSSLQIGVDATTYGTPVRVVDSDGYLTLRVLVDHSIIESFALDGKAAITARVYPTVAINKAARAYLFNNGTTSIKVKSMEAWEMASIDIQQLVI